MAVLCQFYGRTDVCTCECVLVSRCGIGYSSLGKIILLEDNIKSKVKLGLF